MEDGSGLKYFLSDHQGSTVAVVSTGGALLNEQRYLPFGGLRAQSITQTDFGYTGQRELDQTGLMDYKARFYDPSLGRFLQPDLIVSNPANPQTWNRYSYVGNNPANRTDPTGHKACDGESADDCRSGNSTYLEKTDPLSTPKHKVWSTAKYKNEKAGKLFGDLSTRLQHTANFFSHLGAISEIGFTTAGLLGGGAAVGWIDLGFPIADVSGGLAGGLVGWEVGHGLHTLVINPIESGISNASTTASYLSDIAYGNNRIDVYNTNVTIVVGQPTATSAALSFIGGANSLGIVDAAIDQVGSWYSDGKIGGVYDLFGVTGKTFNLSSVGPSWINVQFGDK